MFYTYFRLFDVLCSERTCQPLYSDPRNQVLVLTHPNMTVFRKADLDNSIPLQFWLGILPNFSNLIILDLKFICSDEILEVIGLYCLQLQEVNIVSRVDICKSVFNASVLIRNVSDVGLKSVAYLKKLRILSMDPPRNERHNKIGRCVSQTGIIMLICSLPHLQELRIDTCDIGSTLINTEVQVGPLSLRKINYHFAAADGMRKLLKICPNLSELSVTHLSENNKDDIINEISVSKLKLNRLDLSFFTFTGSLQRLLTVKGCYLTNFCLWDSEQSLSFDALLCIGQCCPNLNTLFLITQSPNLIMPKYFQKQSQIFSELQMLTIGNGFFNIEQMLSFFLDNTNNMQKLVVKYQTKTKIDGILIHLLQKGCFRNVNCLWLDCTFEVSKDTVKEIIKLCENLKMLTVDLDGGVSEIHKYICDNNLDLRLGSY